jgi:hypothetical protein
MVDTLKSYLVALGFSVDQPQLRKFEQALKDAAGIVESRIGGMAAQAVKFQAAVTGAFVGISGAVVALADHAANADQDFRLMGMRMFMSTEQARKLKIGMDALGASMEEIAWDPEINARFLRLSQLQDKLAGGLGPDFERNMRGIRDLRFEFSELRIELEYLSFGFVSKLFERMGTSVEAVTEKLEKWIADLSDSKNFNRITDWLAENFVPILDDTHSILDALWDATKNLTSGFQDLMGVLSGDDSLKDAPVTFENVAKSIRVAADAVTFLVHLFTLAENAVVRFVRFGVDEIGALVSELQALGSAAMAAFALLKGDRATAAKLWNEAKNQDQKTAENAEAGFKQLGLGIQDAALATGVDVILSDAQRKKLAEENPDAKPYMQLMHSDVVPKNPGDTERKTGNALWTDTVSANAPALGSPASPRGIRNNNPGNINFAGQSGAQKEAGPAGRFAVFENAQEGLDALAALLRRYEAKGADTLRSIISRYAPKGDNNDTASYIASVAKKLGVNADAKLDLANGVLLTGLQQAIVRIENGKNPYSLEMYQTAARHAGATFGDIHINIAQPNATPREIQEHVQAALTASLDRHNKQTQRTIAQLANG